MSGICKNRQPNSVRLRARRSLTFFVFGLLLACQPSEESGLAIRWNGQRATGISIPKRLVPSVGADSLAQVLAVRLAGQETALLGNYRLAGNDILFEPLVPLTRGLRYTVWLKSKRLGELAIPTLAPGDRPTLLSIHPSQDSLPQNLLKIYLRFSRPMREGQSQRHVALLKNGTDTLRGVFLDLQPELWNADRTLLTLWLDPGRIKRELQPNQRLGAPLQSGAQHHVVVSSAWPDEQGASLEKSTKKTFLAVERDSLSPLPARWTIYPPASGGRQPLTVTFGEALDFSLLTETLHVIGKDGKPVLGIWHLGEEEKRSEFKPNDVWKAGKYRLRIEGRLEDLAGNNLNRPFDRDVTRPNRNATAQPFVELFFEVR